MDIPPNQTIYVNNLNEKTKKEGMFVIFHSIVLASTRRGFQFVILPLMKFKPTINYVNKYKVTIN